MSNNNNQPVNNAEEVDELQLAVDQQLAQNQLEQIVEQEQPLNLSVENQGASAPAQGTPTFTVEGLNRDATPTFGGAPAFPLHTAYPYQTGAQPPRPDLQNRYEGVPEAPSPPDQVERPVFSDINQGASSSKATTSGTPATRYPRRGEVAEFGPYQEPPRRRIKAEVVSPQVP